MNSEEQTLELLRNLINSLSARETPVADVCAGAFWTIVTSRFSGLATTYRDLDLQHSDHPCMVKNAGELTGMPSGKLAEYALSKDTVSASIGMAAINSLIEIDPARCIEQNVHEVLLEKGAGRRVAVIGHFPFIPRLHETAKEVHVLEKRMRPGDLPADAAAEILPHCDVVCLTGTSLINHTFSKLMALCKKAFVVLTGPTSPMSPLLFDAGVGVIGGCRITHADAATQYIRQAATFRQVKRHGVQLLTMAAQPPN
jgi:hypothetical protein